MRRLPAPVLLAVTALLLTPGAASAPEVPGDPTPPVVTPVTVGTLGSNGWYVTNVTASWIVTDPESIILETVGCDTKTLTADTLGTDLTCSATSDGGTTTVTRTIKIDKTAPALVPDPVPDPNANGWHRQKPLTIKFPGTDATSGIDSCTPDQPYTGGDTTGTPISGSCTDKAGNTSGQKTYTVKYDATAPTLVPDPEPNPNANGWHRAKPLTVKFPGTDATSQIETCTPDQPYNGGDTTGTPITGSCTDKAGNTSGSKTYTVKYDATAPTLVPDPSRGADVNGWYNHSLTVSFPGTDATSTIDVCTLPQTYSGPDKPDAAVSGSCTDKAGNTTTKTFGFQYDATAPTLVPDPVPDPNANGWHRQPLTVKFPGSDPTSGIASCTPDQPYNGGDTTGTPITGSCTDNAGNPSGQKTYTLKYDATKPTAAPAPSPQPNQHGWHRAALTVTFVGSDATSGPDQPSCTVQGYSGPDTQGHNINGTCKDLAGNTSNPSTYTVKYDATKPTATSSPSPQPNQLGWHKAALTVTFVGSDAMSGPDQPSCTVQGYSGPDTQGHNINGTCKDLAGNTSNQSTYTVKYDATAPVLVPDAVPDPNPLGWHRQPLMVKFPGTDATSGIDGCAPDHPYAGPDTTNTPITGSCTDKAGNSTGPKTYTLKYDATAPTLVPEPSRGPDGNGWYSHQLTISFPGIDVTSQIDACTPPQAYSGPDKTNAAVSGSCSDKAGNTTAKTFGFKYDGTAPQVTGITPAPDPTGWYTQPVVFGFLGSDGLSGLDSCPVVTYDGPDGANAFVTGSCFDKAGNLGTGFFPLKYDDTGPAVTPIPSREADSNGWYNHSVAVSFAGSDGASGLASCAPQQSYGGPDSVFAVVSGTCTDKAGNVGLGSLALKYDSTAPQVSGATTERAPDANGWFNRPLSVRFFGSDATSDIDACSVVPYDGPNNPSASVSGFCRDRAGNPSGSNAFPFKYDAVAPSLTKLTVKAGNRSAVLSWEASPDTSLVEIVRTAGASSAGVSVYKGAGRSFTDSGLQNGVRYRYTATGYDEARNAATQDTVATPTAPLSPVAGATVSAPPKLAWRRDEKATYYNVQVWRRGRVFSAWPTGTSIKLTRTWTYNGRRYRLSPGRYRWYVWPGYGARAKKDFGRLIGSSSFIVRR